MEDKSLWEAIKANDLQSLKKLHDRYFIHMCLFARKSVKDSYLTEEIVSDCFIKLWENRSRIEIRISLKSYLFLMLRNALIDHLRKKQFISQQIDPVMDIPDETAFDEQVSFARLYSALQKLPEQRLRILEMAVFESLTYNDIAARLGISRNTVKTQIARAYSALKNILNPRDFLIFCLYPRSGVKHALIKNPV